MDTAIEVRNGNWTKNLAHETRSLLCQEGFTVAKIGNHIDFGAAKTMIYYRPEAERVARAVGRTVFPGAELAPSLKLNKGTDIKVLLGCRSPGKSTIHGPPEQRRAASRTCRRQVSRHRQTPGHQDRGETACRRPPGTFGKEPAKGRAGAAALTTQGQEVKARPLTSSGTASLTVAERVNTAIEVRNGTWTKNLAHETRSLLRQEGFTVAKIGNHLDFGAAKTMIYYRPEAERVARAVGRTIFPGAELEPSLKLKKGMDIKILLGADLLERPQLMARLVAEDK